MRNERSAVTWDPGVMYHEGHSGFFMALLVFAYGLMKMLRTTIYYSIMRTI